MIEGIILFNTDDTEPSTRTNPVLKLSFGGNDKKGRPAYCLDIEVPDDSGCSVIVNWPPIRTMKRLSRMYLECEYLEDVFDKKFKHHYYFSIDAGVSNEKKSAFLGAVAHHTSITWTPNETN